MMPRSISDETKKFFLDVLEVISREPYKFNQKDLALKMGCSVGRIHRIVSSSLPWREAFSINNLGAIGLSGVDITREYPSLQMKHYKPEYPNDPNVIPTGYEAGDPFPRIYAAAQAALAKSMGRSYDKSALLSGQQLSALVESATHFSMQMTRQLNSVRNRANYGKNEWWLDYVDKF